MYKASMAFISALYSGDADYDCRLYINDQLVPVNQIVNINISSPIIDTSQETGQLFHIGTFISQAIRIKFRNLNNITLTNNPIVRLEIGIKVKGEYEYIPIGRYLVDDLAENYHKTCEITCLDYAVKFKPNLDISTFFDVKEGIEAGELFKKICAYYGVEYGYYPETNSHKLLYSYDSNLSGKQYISYLAELMGGNAKIGRDGKCNIYPLFPGMDGYMSGVSINPYSSKNIEIGEKYEISRLCYDNGRVKFFNGPNVISVVELPTDTEDIDLDAYYFMTENLKYYKYNTEMEEFQETNDIKNTLYLRTDNLFINSQQDLDNIWTHVKDFYVYNIKCEHRGAFYLDAWDILVYVVDDVSYYTFNNNEIQFNGVSMGTVNCNIPTGTKAENTNIMKHSTEETIRYLRTEIDALNNTITTTIADTVKQETEPLSSRVSGLEMEKDKYAKKEDVPTVTTIQKQIDSSTESLKTFQKTITENGVTKLDTTTGFKFDANGLAINKTGAKTNSLLNEEGLRIKDATGSSQSDLLFAGYDASSGETIVKSKNMTVEKFFVIGGYSRFENFTRDSEKRTGCFWIGG